MSWLRHTLAIVICLGMQIIKSAELQIESVSLEKKDASDAVDFLELLEKKANDGGDLLAQSDACVRLGEKHFNALGCPENHEKARFYFERASRIEIHRFNRLHACYYLAKIYSQAQLSVVGESKKAWSRKLTSGASPFITQWQMIYLILLHRTMPNLSHAKAKAWMELGTLLLEGRCASKDTGKALEYFKKAAFQKVELDVAKSAQNKLRELTRH